jgi:hypothetical protein
VDVLWRLPLDGGQQVGVEQHLEQRAGLGFAGELGVYDLIGPVAEPAGGVDSDEEIGVTEPGGVEQHPLVDDVGA